MLNRIFLLITISFLFIISVYAASGTIAVEVTGISIIGDNIEKAKESAFQDAFRKALNKVCADFPLNSEPASVTSNPEKYIEGYEILEEKQTGNIFNVTLKVYVNTSLIAKTTKNGFSGNPVYILSVCIKDNVTFEIDRECSDFLRKNLALVPNAKSVLPSEKIYSSETLFKMPKDILAIAAYEITAKKKVYSIGKEFDNLTFHVDIYDANNILLKSFSKKVKILANIGDNPVKYLPDNFFGDMAEFISNLNLTTFSESAKEDSATSFFFIINNPKNYTEVKNVLKIIAGFNINASLVIAENSNLAYKITGISKRELLKILKFSKLDFSSIESNDNITLNMH